MTLASEPFRLSAVLSHVASAVRVQCEQRTQEFVVTTPPCADAVFVGDARRIKQLLLNLLTNAVKYTPCGGCVRFETTVAKGAAMGYRQVKFTVSDNGIGDVRGVQGAYFRAVQHGGTLARAGHGPRHAHREEHRHHDGGRYRRRVDERAGHYVHGDVQPAYRIRGGAHRVRGGRGRRGGRRAAPRTRCCERGGAAIPRRARSAGEPSRFGLRSPYAGRAAVRSTAPSSYGAARSAGRRHDLNAGDSLRTAGGSGAGSGAGEGRSRGVRHVRGVEDRLLRRRFSWMCRCPT